MYLGPKIDKIISTLLMYGLERIIKHVRLKYILTQGRDVTITFQESTSSIYVKPGACMLHFSNFELRKKSQYYDR